MKYGPTRRFGSFADLYSSLPFRGAHLFVIMPMAWQAEIGESKVKEVLEEGSELLKMGWEKDELALKHSIVGVLMDWAEKQNV